MRARWNDEITARLRDGALRVARAAKASVDEVEVAGSFELPAAAELLAASRRYDAVVPLGCLIRGETAHFDVLASVVSRGLMEVGLRHPVAVPFGVLTVENAEQALARSGGAVGDLGADAMSAALELVALRRQATPLSSGPRARR